MRSPPFRLYLNLSALGLRGVPTEIRSSTGSEYGQDSGVVTIREFREEDAPVLWTLSTLPNIGLTADPAMPLALPAAAAAPPQFPDLSGIQTAFVQAWLGSSSSPSMTG